MDAPKNGIWSQLQKYIEIVMQEFEDKQTMLLVSFFKRLPSAEDQDQFPVPLSILLSYSSTIVKSMWMVYSLLNLFFLNFFSFYLKSTWIDTSNFGDTNITIALLIIQYANNYRGCLLIEISRFRYRWFLG